MDSSKRDCQKSCICLPARSLPDSEQRQIEEFSSVERNDQPQRSGMAALNDIVTLYQALNAEWSKKPPKLDKCGDILEKLKISLIEVKFLPTCNNVASQQELLVARDILEIGVQWAVAVKDIAAFERYMAQLKTYYYDYKNELPESHYKYLLLGLNLLFLLSLNRVAEFHTELELLPPESIQSNSFIRHPLALEQYLMEGSYNKIFLAKGNVPSESYNFFMDILLDTVRDEIGACLEKAYNKMSISEAARRLNIPPNAITAYCAKKNWKLNSDNFYQFASDKEEVKAPFPALELAEQTISYASELEMIV